MTKSSLDDFLVLVSRVPGTAYQCLHKKFGLRAFVASEVFHKGRYRNFFKQRCFKQNVAGLRCYKNKLEHYRGQDTLYFYYILFTITLFMTILVWVLIIQGIRITGWIYSAIWNFRNI